LLKAKGNDKTESFPFFLWATISLLCLGVFDNVTP
jgi:hypothetical protein